MKNPEAADLGQNLCPCLIPVEIKIETDEGKKECEIKFNRL